MNQSEKAILIVRSKNDDLIEGEAADQVRQARSIEFYNETSKALFDLNIDKIEP